MLANLLRIQVVSPDVAVKLWFQLVGEIDPQVIQVLCSYKAQLKIVPTALCSCHPAQGSRDLNREAGLGMEVRQGMEKEIWASWVNTAAVAKQIMPKLFSAGVVHWHSHAGEG